MIVIAEYILGSGRPPDWAINKLTPYKKMNGNVGYEFHGAFRTSYLVAGDKLIFSNGRIRFKVRELE